MLSEADSDENPIRLAKFAQTLRNGSMAGPLSVPNDKLMASECGFPSGQQDASGFLTQCFARYGNGGLEKAISGKYATTTTCAVCKSVTETKKPSATFVAPLVRATPTDYVDLWQSVTMANPSEMHVRKRCYN